MATFLAEDSRETAVDVKTFFFSQEGSVCHKIKWCTPGI